MACFVCKDDANVEEKVINANGKIFHIDCFKCPQCFEEFVDGVYFEYDGRLYCESDFQMLYSPLCAGCNKFIIGRIIRAAKSQWHSHCFRCQICGNNLVDSGFGVLGERVLCKPCLSKERTKDILHTCLKCKNPIPEGQAMQFEDGYVHPWHFNCKECGNELDHNFKKKGVNLYCLRCHDMNIVPVCAACRKPIEGRIVNSLGKTWHVEHFCCAKCERPFLGHMHYEKNGLAYCELHYAQLFAQLCFFCSKGITTDAATVYNKSFCSNHLRCLACFAVLNPKSKILDVDQKPYCLRCYDELPKEIRKKLKLLDTNNKRH